MRTIAKACLNQPGEEIQREDWRKDSQGLARVQQLGMLVTRPKYVHVCVHVCVRVCVFMNVCSHLHMCVCTGACVYVHIHVCVCLSICVCSCVCMCR